MGTGLDHAFIVHFDKVMCDMCDDLCEYIYMVDVYGTLGLENITLGVRKNLLNMIVRGLN